MSKLANLEVNSFEHYFSDLAERFGTAVTDHSISIPAAIGSGFIKNLVLEKNFCIRYFNFCLKQELSFDIFTGFPEPAHMYKVLYNLDDNETVDDATTDFSSNRSNVLMYSSNVVRTGSFKKGVHVRRVLILFTTEWLNENYAEASIKMDNLVQDLSLKNKSTLVCEKLDTQSRFVVTQLANELDKLVFPQIHIKTAGFILLNDFLNKLVQRNRKDILSDQTLHYYTMVKVEERICQSINQKLPNIDQLATEFNLSLSTLKRHFKIVYGKNIYQYYQEKRMEWGKAQLEKGNVTISEIATHLGFYKINNFSTAFKKYFGVLPRELKHRNFIQVNS